MPEKFSQQIDNFQRYGTYTYEFDEVGNVVMVPDSSDFSKVYLAFPLVNSTYDDTNIAAFYDPIFTEFIPSSQIVAKQAQQSLTDLQNNLDSALAQNAQLTSDLNTLIESSGNSQGVDPSAAKQVILELRKALGQGRVDSDFSETFPYTPITKTQNLNLSGSTA